MTNIKPKKILQLLAFIIFISTSIHADEIHLIDGTIINGKIVKVTPQSLEYKLSGREDNYSLYRNKISKIKYDDGKIIKFSVFNDKNFIKDDLIDPVPVSKPASGMIWESKTEPLLLPAIVRLSFLINKGQTKVKIYDDNEDRIADGNADIDQYMLKISYEPVESDFYITPEFGYFYRKVNVNDYSYAVEKANQSIDGFIPGIVSNPDTGDIISKNAVSSLAYTSRFHSFFLDFKGGGHIVMGFPGLQFILNPYLYAGIIDYRKSEFEFQLIDRKEKYKETYKFSFFNSYGGGLELGIFFPGLRTGIKIGYDRRYMPKFEIAKGVVFNEIYDENIGGTILKRNRENIARYTSIEANLFTIDFFFFL